MVKSKSVIDVEKLQADVKRLIAGDPLCNDQYMKMIADIPSRLDIFHDTMRHPEDDGLNWLYAWDVYMDERLLVNDVQGALTLCSYAVVRLTAHVATLADAARKAQKRVFHSIGSDEGLKAARKKRAAKTISGYKKICDAVNVRMNNAKETLNNARTHVAANSLILLPELCGKDPSGNDRPLSFDTVRRATRHMKGRKKTKR